MEPILKPGQKPNSIHMAVARGMIIKDLKKNQPRTGIDWVTATILLVAAGWLLYHFI